jgi:thiamine-monophosphate kinase
MIAAASDYDIAIVGGDMTASPLLVLTVTALGRAPAARLARRATVSVGDQVLVTGRLGDAAAGLGVLRRLFPESGVLGPATPDSWLAPGSLDRELPHRWRALPALRGDFPESLSAAVRQFLRPRSLLTAAASARRLGATAMIDISDGLASELHHLSEASGVGFSIDAARVPVGTGARAWGELTGVDPLDLAMVGGEDYELLFTAAPPVVPELTAALQAQGVKVEVIGEAVVRERGVMLIDKDGRAEPLRRAGYEHFGD